MSNLFSIGNDVGIICTCKREMFFDHVNLLIGLQTTSLVLKILWDLYLCAITEVEEAEEIDQKMDGEWSIESSVTSSMPESFSGT